MANKKKDIIEDDLVSEETVQAVAEGIVETAEEDNKSVEEIVDEIIEESKEDKPYEGDLRGFSSLKEALEYPETPAFKKLDIGCRTEYINWLKSIKVEEE